MKRFPFRARRRRPALPRADGRRLGVALPAALPPLWRGRRRHRVPLGRGHPSREPGDASTSSASAPTSARSACRSSAPIPSAMGEAAAFVTDVFQPEFIDINFGCPVKKVVKRNGGSGCLQGSRISSRTSFARVSRSTHLPVTCKIRSGWNEEMRDPVSIALRCQDAGARVLALHPRTRTQMYSGARAGRRSPPSSRRSTIPVLGNGDIKTAEDAVRMHRETGCAGVMIARGSFGQPWIFDQTRDLLEGRPMRRTPRVEERFAIALEHARMAERVRARSARRGDRVPQAPRLVREGAARLGRAAQAAPRRDLARRSRRHLRRVPPEPRPRSSTDASADDGALEVEPRHETRARSRPARSGRERRARHRRALGRAVVRAGRIAGFATIDHHRALRQGFPEVVFGEGKTPEQIVAIATRIAERGEGLLVTRISSDAARRPRRPLSGARAERSSRGRPICRRRRRPPPTGRGTVAHRDRGDERSARRRGGGGDARRAFGNCVARLDGRRRRGNSSRCSRGATSC